MVMTCRPEAVRCKAVSFIGHGAVEMSLEIAASCNGCHLSLFVTLKGERVRKDHKFDHYVFNKRILFSSDQRAILSGVWSYPGHVGSGIMSEAGSFLSRYKISDIA